jgi:ABC-type Fe3+/spermidine/putrescine transport system ATPase subunit
MFLELKKLEKKFGEFTAVQQVDLELERGKVLSLLGPSGCGKTTTLRMIAGFETPTAGTLELGGRDITRLPARRRNIGMVFQSYALFPHLSAEANVAFGLEMRGVSSTERVERVRRTLDVVRMSGLGNRLPKELSGGQQQRIALARALVIEPDLLLLDEPLSALDLKLREEMRDEIHRIVRELGITTVFVTHDQGEALVLSDAVAVMNKGRIEQIDSPQALYQQPRTAFVARFIGGANVLPGRVGPGGADAQFKADCGLSLSCPGQSAGARAVAIRPEEVALASDGHGIEARVERARFLGATIEYTLALGGNETITARTDSRSPRSEGETVRLTFNTEHAVFLQDEP